MLTKLPANLLVTGSLLLKKTTLLALLVCDCVFGYKTQPRQTWLPLPCVSLILFVNIFDTDVQFLRQLESSLTPLCVHSSLSKR